MHIFVLALSRLVPIALLLSLTLVGSRFAHDLVLRTRPHLAKWAFAGVSLVGLIAIVPNILRAGLIVGAQWAANTNRYRAADLLYSDYDAWNGRRSEDTLREWAYVRMNNRDWAGAEEVLRLAETPTPQARILVGICQYYEGNPAAEATLRAVPDMSGTQLCVRDYLLGRIAEKRGDLARAFDLYASSANWEPNFFPSTYQAARLTLQQGNTRAAAAIVDSYTRRFPMHRTAGDVVVLRDAIQRRAVPPEKEFVIVSD
jgi:hypothetical protein